MDLLVLDEDEGVEELVPGQREGEDGGGDDAGRGQRQQDADEGAWVRLAPSTSAASSSSSGRALEEADEEPGAEGDGEGRVGQEQSDQRLLVAPSSGQDAVERDEEQGGRDEVEDEDEAGHRLAAGEAEAGHRVAGRGRRSPS